MNAGKRQGQSMVEYVLVLVVLLGLIAGLLALIGGIRDNSDRTLDLVASEYP